MSDPFNAVLDSAIKLDKDVTDYLYTIPSKNIAKVVEAMNNNFNAMGLAVTVEMPLYLDEEQIL